MHVTCESKRLLEADVSSVIFDPTFLTV